MKKIVSLILCILMLMGSVPVKALELSEIVDEHYFVFDPWCGSGDAKIKADISSFKGRVNADEFEYINYQNNHIPSDDYEIEYGDGWIIFTLGEDFLSSLNDGTHFFTIWYDMSIVTFILYVTREKISVENVIYDYDAYDAIIYLPYDVKGADGNKISISSVFFDSILYNGEVVDKKYYSVSDVMSFVCINFLKEFYDSLPAGEHILDVEFTNVSGIKIRIHVSPRQWAGGVATGSFYQGGFRRDVCYIDNDFFRDYHDKFFKEMYENYKMLSVSEKNNGKKMKDKMYEKVRNFINEEFYLCLYLTETGADISSIKGITGVKYTSEKYPCAVVAVNGGDDIDSIIADEKVEYIGYSFDFTAPFWGDPGWSLKTYYTAADARKVLRISAGLDSFDCKESYSIIDEYMRFFALDSNNDGTLTATDARNVLRVAAGLSEPKEVIFPY